MSRLIFVDYSVDACISNSTNEHATSTDVVALRIARELRTRRVKRYVIADACDAFTITVDESRTVDVYCACAFYATCFVERAS